MQLLRVVLIVILFYGIGKIIPFWAAMVLIAMMFLGLIALMIVATYKQRDAIRRG